MAIQEDWQSYKDPAEGYQLSHPPGWAITSEDTKTAFREPEGRAEFVVWRLSEDCDSVRKGLRAGAGFNLHTVREFQVTIAHQQPMPAVEFLDTMSNLPEFRSIVPSRAGAGCFQLQWRRAQEENAAALSTALSRILSTFDVLPERPLGGPSSTAID